jgi:hypothetical protein
MWAPNWPDRVNYMLLLIFQLFNCGSLNDEPQMVELYVEVVVANLISCPGSFLERLCTITRDVRKPLNGYY